jgi:hypothetical protein
VKNNLQYYIDEIRRQNPGLSDKDVNTYANKFYRMDPNSDYTGKRTKADPAFKLFNANAKAGTTAAANVTPTPTPTKGTKVNESLNQPDFTPIGSGIQTNFEQFVDGTLVRNAGGPGSISMEPFITGRSSPEQPSPKPIAILPTNDGRGFIVSDLDSAVNDYISRIPRGEEEFYKKQLQKYYSSDKDFRKSIAGGPVTDKDVAFSKAIKAAIQEITVNNFDAGTQQGLGVKNKTILEGNSAGFYSFDNWILSRINTQPISESSRSSGLTTRADALAEFRRTVQQYVGEFDLVNNYDALAEAYWQKLHKEEKARMSQSTSITDPITGNRTSRGISYTQLSEQDRLEMRINFITKGAMDKKGKVISTGIREAEPLELQDAGGTIGDNYTKLKSYAYDYGVKLSDAQIKEKAAESLLPGGSIDEQKRSIQMASRALYKGLDSYIQAGLKVSDVADQYRKLKASELELADGSVDIFDTDVQSALTADKLMDPMTYTGLLRQNPDWKYTRKANESAAGLVDTILKTWGVVG